MSLTPQRVTRIVRSHSALLPPQPAFVVPLAAQGFTATACSPSSATTHVRASVAHPPFATAASSTSLHRSFYRLIPPRHGLPHLTLQPFSANPINAHSHYPSNLRTVRSRSPSQTSSSATYGIDSRPQPHHGPSRSTFVVFCRRRISTDSAVEHPQPDQFHSTRSDTRQ